MTLEQWAQRWNLPQAAMIELQQLSTVEMLPQEVPERSEPDVSQNIRVKSSMLGLSAWRNNNGAFKDPTGRLVRFGLGHTSAALNRVWKSGDLVGIGPRGRFTMVEVKDPGWTFKGTDREKAQLAAINQVNALGGIGFFASSSAEYVHMMEVNR